MSEQALHVAGKALFELVTAFAAFKMCNLARILAYKERAPFRLLFWLQRRPKQKSKGRSAPKSHNIGSISPN